jgi:rSAM/selenodomain-associated transferase 2
MNIDVSIVIPVLNEEENIGTLLDYLKKNGGPVVKQIIVVDGGSTDQTADIAAKKGAEVIRTDRKGRAVQMNAGASLVRSPVCYFLHADTFPPENFGKLIAGAIKKGADAGCFRLRFDDGHPFLAAYAWFTRFKTTLVRFGDQSLFVKTGLFVSIGRFDERLKVMEDQEIVRRIRRTGRFELIPVEVQTSAGKYRKNGILKLQFIFSVIFILYYLGASQQTLVHLYQNLIRTNECIPKSQK